MVRRTGWGCPWRPPGTGLGAAVNIDANLIRVKACIEWSFDLHERAPRISPQAWAANYLYSRCINCGVCLAACPQFGPDSDFVGPNALAQVHLANAHPTVGYARAERLHAIMAEGGLTECGNAQNCIEVCPKQIPLTTAIGELGRAVTVQAIKDLFGGYEAIWLPPEAREPDETPARLRGGTLQVQGLPSSSEPAPWVPVEAGCRARGL